MVTSTIAPAPDNGLLTAAPAQMPVVEDFASLEEYLRAALVHHCWTSCPRALELWLQASNLLWQADTREEVYAAAALAQDAVCEFTASKVRRDVQPAGLRAGPLERLSILLAVCRPQLGEDSFALLDGLLAAWETLAGAILSDEDPAARPAGRLRWEDGRRAVLLAALLIVELERVL